MKTENMDTSKDYFENHLSGDMGTLMLCIAPFTDVFHKGWKGFYTDHLIDQAELKDLPYTQWDAALQEAEQRGLVKPHPHFNEMGYLVLESGFSKFLKSRLKDPAMARVKKAIESAFCAHYNEIGGELAKLLMNEDSETRQTGRALIGIENENLMTAVTICLSKTSDFYPAFDALSLAMIQQQNFTGLTQLCELVMSHYSHYTSDQLAGDLGTFFFTVNDRLAGGCLRCDDEKYAKIYYEKGLTLSEQSNDPHVKRIGRGQTLTQLSRIAEQQKQWDTATDHALAAARLFSEHDEQNFMLVVAMLAHIWEETKDATITETIAELKGQSKEDVEDLLTRINQPGEDDPA